MTGEYVEEEVVRSSCPCSLGDEPGCFYNPLVKWEYNERSWNVLNENDKGESAICMISSPVGCGWNY